ncbi:hypothetical protein FF011L_45130 [Roseimaritima multifibrata]|uniref:Planctomycete cytochrome C n=1 Tax=Roseimaritima multifibrata TaxID=1930274 RepID=A0A517MLG1_9BACT|nr:DUF1592 domain-containing protein [Roseimaritima multifibrata]QDS95713.1 hypothetical protein FF011L_45130 [Roseimaritima multifibrata]
MPLPNQRSLSLLSSPPRFFAGIGAVILWTALAFCAPLSADQASNEPIYQEQLLPLLRTYCLDCHAVDGDSEVQLDKDQSALQVQQNRAFWNHVVTQVRSGSMPPADGEVMDAANREKMLETIEKLVNSVDCVQQANPGKVALRRLNRIEYRNTIHDLTGIDYQPSEGFPGDDVGYGFDNIGDVLSLPPLLMEKYLDAAETITGQAIITPLAPRLWEININPATIDNAKKYVRQNGLTLASRGTVTLNTEIPFTGDYVLTMSASGDQGGDDPVRVEIKAGKFQTIVDVPSEAPENYPVSLSLKKGKASIDLTFTNDFYVEGKVDRNFHLHHLHLEGTERQPAKMPPLKLTDNHRKIIFAVPSEKLSAEDATTQVLSRFGSRSFRRPITKGELDRLSKLAAQVRSEGGSYEESIQVAIQAILVSPHFLYRVEQPGKGDPEAPMPLVSQFELASRLSYFLWSSMPDDELLRLAYRGELRDPEKLRDKIRRMIADPRAAHFIENFAGQWLQLRNLDRVQPDTEQFPEFSDATREQMKRETLLLFAEVLRKNLPVTTLLDADYTFLNHDLAKFYGIQGISGDEFRKVALADTPRRGLLTHASVLTITSNAGRTSPVKRGKWIMENLLNTPPPPAPPNVPELDKSELSGTLRERMEQHRANPACAACHNVMDQLGFALENFGPVGHWRTHDGKEKIDSSGKLPDGTEFNGAADLTNLLTHARREQFVRCLAEKTLIYAVGRGTDYYDRCAIDEILAKIEDNDSRYGDMVFAIIASDPFQRVGSRSND